MSCPDCTSGNLLPGSPKGTEENGVYLAKGSNLEDTKDKAVVILTDIFGLSISNPKIIADTIAERTGCDVWVPDLFNGALSTVCAGSLFRLSVAHLISLDYRPGHPPVKPEVLDFFLPRSPGEKMGFWRTIRFYLTLLTYIPGMFGCRSGVVDPRATEVFPSLLRPAD
jgi:carboxymethylenebutenolidase